MFHYTHVLLSEKDDNFYTGYTKNLKLRFEQHEKGQVESTRDGRPLRLSYYEACLDQNDATKREKYFKTYYGKMFLKSRLKSYSIYINAIALAQPRFGTPIWTTMRLQDKV